MSRDDGFDGGTTGAPEGDAWLLEHLVGEYIDRVNRGDEIDPAEIISAHPDLAADILRELETFRCIESNGLTTGALGTIGDYTLRRRIGRGGMGVVYDAWQNSMDRQVALKVLPPGVAADHRAFHRFMREAKTAGQLQHRNIAAVYAMGVDQNTPYYAMEFIDGETLARILARLRSEGEAAETPFGATREQQSFYYQMAEALAEVADGLQHAHSRGVIHRDIKPSNLILARDGKLRILDFGLAHLEGQESLTVSGDLMGTVLYMSPEQAMAKRVPIDHRTDVYSLGATLYEALTGEPPFRGSDQHETLSRIIVRDPRSPRQLNPRVPRDLETIVLKCLRKDPKDRYGTAEALDQDLRRFARGDAIEARPPTRWERTWRKVWRQKAWIGAVAVTVLVAVIGLSLAGVLRQQRLRDKLEQYGDLVTQAIAALEIGLPLAQGGLGEGEAVSLGLLSPEDVDECLAFSVDDAVKSLRDAVATLPARPEAYFHLSRALWARGDRAEAEAALEQALARRRDFLPALLLDAHRFRDRGRAEVGPSVPGSIEAIADEPWERSWLDAHSAAVRGDWAGAYRSYTRLLDEVDHSVPGGEAAVRLRRGRVALRLGQPHRALEDFLAVAQKTSARAVGPAVLRATAYYLARLPDEAASVLETIQKEVPVNCSLVKRLSALWFFASTLAPASGAAQISPDYSTFLGGSTVDVGEEVAVGPDGSVYVLGTLVRPATSPDSMSTSRATTWSS